MLAGVDAAAWPVFIEERSRERKLGTSVSGRILSAGPGVPSPPPSTYNSASARLQPAALRHADPSFIKVRDPPSHSRFSTPRLVAKSWELWTLVVTETVRADPQFDRSY